MISRCLNIALLLKLMTLLCKPKQMVEVKKQKYLKKLLLYHKSKIIRFKN